MNNLHDMSWSELIEEIKELRKEYDDLERVKDDEIKRLREQVDYWKSRAEAAWDREEQQFNKYLGETIDKLREMGDE